MCAGSNPGHLSVNGFAYMSPTRGAVLRHGSRGRALTDHGRTARGSDRVTRLAFCITVTNESVRSMMRSPFDDVATTTGPPSSNAPAAPPQATSTSCGSRGGVREAIDIAQVVGVFRREDPARHDDRARQDGRDRIEALALIVREAEAAQVFVGDDRRAAGRPDPHFQVAEAVERVGATAGGDAAAVLRPGRRVLDVPELSVERRESCQRLESAGRSAPAPRSG